VLARLLLPEDFGKVGMVMVITGFASVFFEMGFGDALIQKEKLTKEDLSSVFWFNLIMGLILSSLLFILSPTIASFYNTPSLVPISQTLSLVFIFNSINVVQLSILKREINFKKIALINIVSIFISGTISIVMA